MDTELIHIDEMTSICGYFSSENRSNNYYNCNHEGCGDSDLMQKISGEWNHTKDISYDRIIAPKMTTRKISCNRRLAKKFIKKARKLSYYNLENIKKYGLKNQGKCFCFSCPFGHEADKQDFKEHNETEFEHDYMVVSKETLEELRNHKKKYYE